MSSCAGDVVARTAQIKNDGCDCGKNGLITDLLADWLRRLWRLAEPVMTVLVCGTRYLAAAFLTSSAVTALNLSRAVLISPGSLKYTALFPSRLATCSADSRVVTIRLRFCIWAFASSPAVTAILRDGIQYVVERFLRVFGLHSGSQRQKEVHQARAASRVRLHLDAR